MSYQKIQIVGNLAAKPEMRYTPDGKPYSTFRMASNDFGNTTWFRVTVWGNQAEPCANNLDKGRQVLVDGRLTGDKATGSPKIWTDNSGNARASFEVSASRVVFLGGSPGARREEPAQEKVDTSDIPF